MTSDLNFNSQFADGLRGFILENGGWAASTKPRPLHYDCSMNMCVVLDMKGWKYPKNYLKDGRIVDPMKEKRPAKTGLILSLNSVSILSAWVVRHISLLHPSGFVGMYLTVRTFLRTRSYPVFWNALKICLEVYREKQSFICCSLC